VRKRRNDNRGLAARAAGIAASLAWLIWAKAARRPVDSFALLAAAAGSLIIIVNAVFLQSRSLPAPFFVNSLSAQAASHAPPPRLESSLLSRPSPSPSRAPSPSSATTIGAVDTADAVSDRRNDPIAELIGRTSRIMAVQRALTDYGYGQIKPTGVIDRPTSAAIERFEREHNMPVTGKVSDRLVNELAVLIGHPLQ
jgi:hypothetical protein